MRIFLCAGEPSGDLHGANLIRELKQRRPDLEFVGYGGDHMEAAGCKLLYPLCRMAVMWFVRVLMRLHFFMDLISKADRYFRHHRPDAVILIDYPGFNWWMARRAKFHGIPVFYFVPPQLWGWAGWRVKKMRRFVDHVLCNLPFEKEWYDQRGVSAHYIGHPFFDEIEHQHLDAVFMEQQRQHDGPIIGLLPGSRGQEVERNWSSMVHAAEAIHAERPDVRFLTACFRKEHQMEIADNLRSKNIDWIHTHVGRTPEIISLAHSCISVSGSVALELMAQRKPTVIVYRIGSVALRVCKLFKTSKYICLVNLLADKELYPEFLTDRSPGIEIAGQVVSWLNNGETHQALIDELHALLSQIGQTGACGRAAEFVLEKLSADHRKPLAA